MSKGLEKSVKPNETSNCLEDTDQIIEVIWPLVLYASSKVPELECQNLIILSFDPAPVAKREGAHGQ